MGKTQKVTYLDRNKARQGTWWLVSIAQEHNFPAKVRAERKLQLMSRKDHSRMANDSSSNLKEQGVSDFAEDASFIFTYTTNSVQIDQACQTYFKNIHLETIEPCLQSKTILAFLSQFSDCDFKIEGRSTATVSYISIETLRIFLHFCAIHVGFQRTCRRAYSDKTV